MGQKVNVERKKQRAASFAFLQAVSEAFVEKYRGKIQSAGSGAMEKEFSPEFKSLMSEFNTKEQTSREENINQLVTNTAALSENAQVFRRSTSSLRRHQQWRHARIWICTVIGIIVVL